MGYTKILEIERLKNSFYGNPNYLITIEEDGHLVKIRTAPNSCIAYSITTERVGQTKQIEYKKLKNFNRLISIK